MANSLLTGVSGLTSHQHLIEVVGNNLANLNTAGFKSRRAHFADVFYETVKGGAGGGVGAVQATNPTQVGNGSRLASVAVDFSQGILETTGSRFDFAIDGDGFFVLDSGKGDVYTRAGVFNVDNNGFLVDSATGFHVQRFGTIGDNGGTLTSFQTPGDKSISIPLGITLPGQATSTVSVSGNLSPQSGAALPQIIESANPFTASGVAADSMTTLNSLDIVTTPFTSGDSIIVSGTDADGTAVNVSVPVDASTTVGAFLAAIDAAFPGATPSLTADGTLQLTAASDGVSLLSLNLTADPGNTGVIDLSAAHFVTLQQGTTGDLVRGAMEVFDERGDGHVVGLLFVRGSDGSWSVNAELNPDEGTIVDGSISGINFGSNGAIQSITGPDSQFVFHFKDQTDPQVVQLDFGAINTLQGLTMLPGESSVASIQDGFSTGALVDFNVEGNGLIEGIGSNGLRFPIAQVALATFKNSNGLSAEGNNFFSESIASGSPTIGQPGNAGRGRISSGRIENSNVDIAIEFTRLIIAQRGFSANARTITVTDEVLDELNNLIR